MNRKERRLAYATALNSAAGNITVVPDFQVGCSCLTPLAVCTTKLLLVSDQRSVPASALCTSCVSCAASATCRRPSSPACKSWRPLLAAACTVIKPHPQRWRNLTCALGAQADLTPKTKELTTTLQKWGADLGKHSLLVTSELSKQLWTAGAPRAGRADAQRRQHGWLQGALRSSSGAGLHLWPEATHGGLCQMPASDSEYMASTAASPLAHVTQRCTAGPAAGEAGWLRGSVRRAQRREAAPKQHAGPQDLRPAAGRPDLHRTVGPLLCQ